VSIKLTCPGDAQENPSFAHKSASCAPRDQDKGGRMQTRMEPLAASRNKPVTG